MKKNLSKIYEPEKAEEKIYRLWLKAGFFNPDKLPLKYYSKKSKYFITLLPPPNITGSLHLGHALNAAIQDILIRWKRMKGYKSVWLPGTDHAGIATQNAVEKALKKEGVSRFDLGREKFIERVWQWREEYGNIILKQLQKLGVSCDWSRLRFTMDKNYTREVQSAFIHYFKKGLIYRGQRVVNWCPRCQTSISDLEVEYKEEKTKLYYIKYPISQQSAVSSQRSAYVVVATTRPETMLGDAAVAVNPKDKRYKNLIGQYAILPIQNRKIPIIADSRIDLNFGTGAVKITPAHDLLDAEIAERHNLNFHQVIDENGKMTKEVGDQYVGLSAEECRNRIIAELEKLNLIKKIEDYIHNVALCYRCGAKIEPILSQQWFLKMSDLAAKASKAVKSGKVKIIPKNFEKVYFDWLKNIRDWCISRQLWWGQALPVFYCNEKKEEASNFIVSLVKPKKCPFCGQCEMKQSEEILDTWFSSALWPFAGLKEKDRKRFYPSDVLVTARDIINLWVGRMVFSGLEFQKKEPFRTVFIHATILTKEKKRMSKSLGTGTDPIELIKIYGADATRFGLIWQSMGLQDIAWDEQAVIAGKKFANKIWNAARFVLSNKPPRINTNFEHELPRIKNLTMMDKKILSGIKEVKKNTEKNLVNFRFGQALHLIYEFFWHSFCDKYLEESKKQLQNPKQKENTQKILIFCLLESLKILHPFMPHLTENIYQLLPTKKKKILMIESW